ncbi:MAG: hypothetical protein Q4D98_04435 [Planctomycetia bacterium]|nr:hypothetical protein [Planctomycetia bacterium]
MNKLYSNCKKSQRFNAAEVKDFVISSGRAVEVLSAVAGISPEVLDGKDRPCPHCGGRDRFRLLNAETGMVRCWQKCFTGGGSETADIFAVVQAMTGSSFPQAVRAVAEYVGVSLPARTKSPRVGAGVEAGQTNDRKPVFVPWGEEVKIKQLGIWAKIYGGVSGEAAAACGAMVGDYGFPGSHGEGVVAFPQYQYDHISETRERRVCAWTLRKGDGSAFRFQGAKSLFCSAPGWGHSYKYGLAGTFGRLDTGGVKEISFHESITDAVAVETMTGGNQHFGHFATCGNQHVPKAWDAVFAAVLRSAGVDIVNLFIQADEGGKAKVTADWARKWKRFFLSEGLDVETLTNYGTTADGQKIKDVRDYNQFRKGGQNE